MATHHTGKANNSQAVDNKLHRIYVGNVIEDIVAGTQWSSYNKDITMPVSYWLTGTEQDIPSVIELFKMRYDSLKPNTKLVKDFEIIL
jgi:hypothetical protein